MKAYRRAETVLHLNEHEAAALHDLCSWYITGRVGEEAFIGEAKHREFLGVTQEVVEAIQALDE